MQVTDGWGRRRHRGPHALGTVHFVPSRRLGSITGALHHRIHSDIAVFRGLEICLPGEHSLRFCLHGVLSAATWAPVQGGHLTLWVRPPEAATGAAGEPDFLDRVHMLRAASKSALFYPRLLLLS